MDKKIELLAPAGDMNSLRAAVENGADAVYLGGKHFNARQNTDNFDEAELKKALEYAHVRGVKIYLTMNTLISDSEMEDALRFAGEWWLMGVDGIIVQDIGFADLLKRTFPDISLHASTQMTVYNLEGIRILEKMGFSRAVLARELPLEEIKYITAGTSLDIEIFIHGALCISYSGQCLMSSIIGGRSGNRGKCAQPCRLPYKLIRSGANEYEINAEEPQYIMSPKDICTLQSIEDIVASGVRSLKIEGRMKSPEYVATVVRVYRKYLDLALAQGKTQGDGSGASKISIKKNDMEDLTQIFNRGGFSKGYLYGKTGRDMMCFEKPKNWGVPVGITLGYNEHERIVKIRLSDKLSIGDGIEIWNDEDESPGAIVSYIKKDNANVKSANKGDIVSVGYVSGKISGDYKVYKTSDKELINYAKETYSGKSLKKVKLEGFAVLKTGQPFTLKVIDSEMNEAVAHGSSMPENALNKPLTVERITEQLKKTGQTPFEFTNIEVEMDDDLILPVSEINEVRRRALEDLESSRMRVSRTALKINQKVKIFSDTATHKNKDVHKISLYFYKWDNKADYSSYGADRIYLPLTALLDNAFGHISELCHSQGIEIFIWLPTITKSEDFDLIKGKIVKDSIKRIDGILIGNLGTDVMLDDIDHLRITGDVSLNIFNSSSLDEVARLGLEGVALSPELTLEQVCNMAMKAEPITETVVYGRLPIMTSEYCPVGSVKGDNTGDSKCTHICATGQFKLKDRMDIEFPIICDPINCRSTILNSNVIFVPDIITKLKNCGVNVLRLYIWDEKPDTIKKLVNLHKELAESKDDVLLKRKDFIDQIKATGFTKGHYFRGV